MSFFSNVQKPVSGSICQVQILPSADASKVLLNYQDFIASITPAGGKAFEDLVYSARTLSFDDRSKDTEHGVRYEYELKCKLAGLSASLSKKLYENRLGEFFIRLSTRDQEFVLCHMQMMYKSKHPGKVVSYSGYEVVFVSVASVPLMFSA